MPSVSKRQEPVLEALAEITKPHGEWCVSFARIADAIPSGMLTRRRNETGYYLEVRRLTRALVRKGYAEYVRGLFDEGTGLVAGSGHCITVEGLQFLGNRDIDQAIKGTLK